MGRRHAAATPNADDGIRDWDDLFHVMRASLGETGDEPLDLLPQRWTAGKPPSLSPALLRCVAALHRLHATVLRRIDRPAQIERELFDAAGSPVALGNLEVSVRPRLGIAVVSADAGTAASLLKRAERAAHRAARRTTSYDFFDPRAPAGDA